MYLKPQILEFLSCSVLDLFDQFLNLLLPFFNYFINLIRCTAVEEAQIAVPANRDDIHKEDPMVQRNEFEAAMPRPISKGGRGRGIVIPL